MPTSSVKGPRSLGRSGSKYLTSRKRVLEADQICWLCGELIDLRLKYPDPMYGTVDHIIPESELTDRNDPRHWDPKNLKPAHLSCNARRGTGKMKVEHPSSLTWRV
jgi:5-methylcytosine-specific restriction endonuclease McrA